MVTEKKVRRKKIKSKTPRKYSITLSERIWIKDLPPTKIKIIESGFEEGKYLPFYKSSGTSVITSRKPPDFESLYLKKSEFQNYHPDLFRKPSTKKRTKKKEKK